MTAIGKDVYFYQLGHVILGYNKSVYSIIPTKSKDLNLMCTLNTLVA